MFIVKNRIEYERRCADLKEKLNVLRVKLEIKEQQIEKHFDTDKKEIFELYHSQKELFDQLVKEMEEHNYFLSEELESACRERDIFEDDTVRLSFDLDHKGSLIDKFNRRVGALIEICANPKNNLPRETEPCVFFTHFGKVLVNEYEWRDAFFVMRRQRKGLSIEMKSMFRAFEAEDGEFVSKFVSSYKTIGVLSLLCYPNLAIVDAFESPCGYRPADFIYPRQDYLLNKHSRFLLLKTAHAVGFFNTIVDGRYDETLDSDYSSSTKRSSTTLTTVPSKIRRRSHNRHVVVTKRTNKPQGDSNNQVVVVSRDSDQRENDDDGDQRGNCESNTSNGTDNVDVNDRNDEDNDVDDDDDDDDEDDRAGHDERAGRVESIGERNKHVTKLIEKIVERYPELSVALTLRRYRYKLTTPEVDPNDRCPLNWDASRVHGTSDEYHTAPNIYYSIDRNATAPQMLRAITMLWEELTTAMEHESGDSLQVEIETLNELFNN